jgi:AcrR family transcriptional regulator
MKSQQLFDHAIDIPDKQADALTEPILDAALRQFELFGISRSTMEDIARRAGLSRVTVYRRFAGKDRLVEAVILRELGSFLRKLDELVVPLESPEQKLLDGFLFTLSVVRAHPLLHRLLESEPEILLPHLTTHAAPFIAPARDFLAGHLARELDDTRPGEELLLSAELVVRLLISFLLTPQTLVDLDDPTAARRFAEHYLRPLLAGETGG